MSEIIIAIDPGNVVSGYVVINADDYTIYGKGIADNTELIETIDMVLLEPVVNNLELNYRQIKVVIEGFKSYGMPIGQTTIDAIWWSGRFFEFYNYYNPYTLYRKDIKLNLCGKTNAKDTNVTGALVERFTPNLPNFGKGTKKEQGYFYGFKKDIWAAMGIAVTYIDFLQGRFEIKKT